MKAPRPLPLHPERSGLEPIAAQVADITDAERFPNIAEALRHARQISTLTKDTDNGR